MNKSESIVEISKALTEFRKEVKQPMKDADNPFFKSKYVPLPNVVEAIDETAPKHGLSFVQWLLNDETGQMGVATMIMHNSGEFIEFDPVFMKAEKQTPQGAGSLATYLKRYTLSAAFGITSDEDDDGNQATGNNNKQNNQQYRQPQQQDKGKVQLVQQNAQDLSDIINANVEESKQTTKQQILSAYLEKVGAQNMDKATNEQLLNMSKLIKQNIAKYDK